MATVPEHAPSTLPNDGAPSNDSYNIPETRLGEARHLRIITIGAGAAGLNLAYQINKHMQNVTHVVYEKNPEVGGTWYENRYPGCACDIPSHTYQFTWAPNPHWDKFYSSGHEILQYLRSLAEKNDLYKSIKLSHRVAGAEWHVSEGIWRVTIEDLTSGTFVSDWCNFMVNGSGVLNNWKWPDIPGLSTFKGQLFHSAAWDASADWRGKKVAVLGCGSTGVQIVPTIQPEVEQLITFIRSPTWITAGFAQNKAGPDGANFSFTAEQKREFSDDLPKYLKYRKEIEAELNSRFKFIIKNSPEQAEAMRYSAAEMTRKLGSDSPVLKHILPTFNVGCRRPTPGNGYLEALTQANVRVVTDSIVEIVPEGVKTSTGETLKVDMFICATGFDVSFRPRYPVIGQNGIQLSEQWRDKPEAYLSLAVPNFPNHFMFLGPNAPIGHGSVLPLLEHAAKYMIQIFHKCQTESIKSVVPKHQAVDDFSEHTRLFMDRTAWSSSCRSWFKNGTVDGPITALHPGSRVHWFHMLYRPRFEDYEWESWSRNRFAYLGNGFSTKELAGKDSTFYLDGPEEGFEVIQY